MEFEDQDDHSEELELPLPEMANPAAAIDAQPQQQRKPRYRECLKNHAVGLGGHAVDGCCEFLPAGVEGSLDALKCAACNCHRNFHRKDTDHASPSSAAATTNDAGFNFTPHPHPQHHPPFLLPHHVAPQYYRTPSGYLHVGPPRPLALPSTSGGGGGGSYDQEDISNLNNTSSGGGGGSGGSGGKRYRTKFTAEQKEKMLELAEKLGWRIQKHDDEVIQQFCNETGVKRHVLKVWMHNNKHTIGKKP